MEPPLPFPNFAEYPACIRADLKLLGGLDPGRTPSFRPLFSLLSNQSRTMVLLYVRHFMDFDLGERKPPQRARLIFLKQLLLDFFENGPLCCEELDRFSHDVARQFLVDALGFISKSLNFVVQCALQQGRKPAERRADDETDTSLVHSLN